MVENFHGAKAAVFIDELLLLYQRDPDVPWGGMWDMPGGGREGVETPRQCLARELMEEFQLEFSDAEELWHTQVPAMNSAGEAAWFFVIRFPSNWDARICFGDEGQEWRLFSVKDALSLPNLIAPLRARLCLWLRREGDRKQ